MFKSASGSDGSSSSPFRVSGRVDASNAYCCPPQVIDGVFASCVRPSRSLQDPAPAMASSFKIKMSYGIIGYKNGGQFCAIYQEHTKIAPWFTHYITNRENITQSNKILQTNQQCLQCCCYYNPLCVRVCSCKRDVVRTGI